jgi:hypothetical protein
VLGRAKLALHFQTFAQASLHGIVKTHRSSPQRMALLRFARGAINFEPRMTWMDTDKAEGRGTQGCAWTGQTGGPFSNPSTSELAGDCENTSLIR